MRLEGRQPKRLRLGFDADFVAVLYSEADLTKVYVSFNEPHHMIPLAYATRVTAPKPVIRELLLRWEQSETGKNLLIYYAGAPSIHVGVNVVTIGADYVGFAREETLQSLLNLVSSMLDTQLSTRASEATLQAIRQQTDRLVFDPNSNLRISIANDEVGLKQSIDAIASKIDEKLGVQLLAAVTKALDNSTGTATALLQMLDTDLTIEAPGIATLQMYFDSSVTVRAKIVRGGQTHTPLLNSGSPLAANSIYEFSLHLNAGDALNVLVEVPAGQVVNGYLAVFYRVR